MTNANSFSYSARPIGSIPTLARALGFPVARLLKIAGRANGLFIGPIIQRKPNGKLRETFDAKPQLKVIHEAIRARILVHVVYPSYVMGGVKDPHGTRGYVRSAQLHAGAKLLIGGDIENFFPSVPIGRVISIFMHVCKFPRDVSTVLAQLCTKDGALVQGAKTSTALANLALYREEPAMVERLTAMGVPYGRFVDDMNGSLRRFVTLKVRTAVVQEIRSTIEKAGLRPKREKQFVAGAGSRMQIHKLNVNTRASRPVEYRQKLRGDIHRLQIAVESGVLPANFESDLSSAATRVGGMMALNPDVAVRVKLELKKLKKSRANLARQAEHSSTM